MYRRMTKGRIASENKTLHPKAPKQLSGVDVDAMNVKHPNNNESVAYHFNIRKTKIGASI